jgi:glycosyltransferase involved in cell wall biosynthesis
LRRSTHVGGVADVMGDPPLGRLVAADDSDALAAALVELLTSPDRAALGQRARAAVVDRYDFGRLVSDLDTLYRALAGPLPEVRALDAARSRQL